MTPLWTLLLILSIAAVRTAATCGGTVTTSGSVIESPRYPNLYPNNVNCAWTITAPPDTFAISFSFDAFDLESSRECSYYDWVLIEDSAGNVGDRRYCGHSGSYTTSYNGYRYTIFPPAIVHVLDTQATLRFRTDGSVRYSGFSVNVTFSDRPECPKPTKCKNSEGETEELFGPDGFPQCVCKGCGPVVCPSECQVTRLQNIPHTDCDRCVCARMAPWMSI